MDVGNIISSVSVAIASLAFVSGVSAWKREYVGKRRTELAEEALALFYEAADVIRFIRSPVWTHGERITRERSENETPEESRKLDTAYRATERYRSHEQLFSRLRAVKYRYMTFFGKDAAKPYAEIDLCVRQILAAGSMLANYYWRESQPQDKPPDKFEQLWRDCRELESVFWDMGNEDDKIRSRIESAIKQVEEIARRESAHLNSPWGSFWNSIAIHSEVKEKSG